MSHSYTSRQLKEAKNYGLQFVQDKYGLNDLVISRMQRAMDSVGTGSNRTERVKSGNALGTSYSRAGFAEMKPPTPPGTTPGGGGFERPMGLNLENDLPFAQGYQREHSQPTAISSLISGLLRQSQTSSADYWQQFFSNKPGSYNLAPRDSSPWGVDPVYTPPPAPAGGSTSGGGSSKKNKSSGSSSIRDFFRGLEDQETMAEQETYNVADPNNVQLGEVPNSFTAPWGNYAYVPSQRRLLPLSAVVQSGLATGPIPAGKTFTVDGVKYGYDSATKSLTAVTSGGTTTPPTGDGGSTTGSGGGGAPVTGGAIPTPNPGTPPTPPKSGVYNPWGFGEGGKYNNYGPTQQHMTQATMEALALANAYFAPQRMELAYELGDMETDMRRLATNLGRQVDDPVLQAKLFKESMRAVRTLDAQQNTFAFQMAEQRRREETQNYQFYNQLAHEEYKLGLQNYQFLRQLELQADYYNLQHFQFTRNLELQGQYFNLQRELVASQLGNPPAPATPGAAPAPGQEQEMMMNVPRGTPMMFSGGNLVGYRNPYSR